MLKQITTLAFAIGLAGCTTTNNNPNADQLKDEVKTINTNIAEQHIKLIKLFKYNQARQQKDFIALTRQINQLNLKVAKLKQPPAKIIVKEIKQCNSPTIGDKFILGAVENVYVDEVKASFETRIDTGAESSSLDAENIVLFERNSKQWVRFDVFVNGHDKAAKTFEAKVKGFVRIKQSVGQESDRRPIIHAHLKIGQYKAETDVNLVDRSHLNYQLLLGRKFMQDIAVVDVAKSFIHGRQKAISTQDNKG